MADLFSSVLGGSVGGTAVGAAIVRLSLDSKQYQTQLAGAKGQTTAGLNAMGASASKFSTAMKTAFLVAGIALVAFLVSSTKAAMDAQVVMAQTEAVLKSTGGAAGVTAQEISDLAQQWQGLTGVEDEAVQAGMNILLTFTKVRSEIGADNDIFAQATAAMLDMATAMNLGVTPSAEGLKAVALQLGKALNEPITGMSALRRAGVSFTAEQREMIKTLAESGDVLGAQKIILKEVEVEFGNAAEAAGVTFAGSISKLSAEFNDLQETIGGVIVVGLLPWLEAMNEIVNLVGRGFGPATLAFDEFTDAVRAGATEGAVYENLLRNLRLSGALTTDQTMALAEAYLSLKPSLGGATEATKAQTDSLSGLNAEMRETISLQLQFTGGLLGLVSSVAAAGEAEDELAAAQRKVNNMQAAGRTDTKAYAQALADLDAAALGSIQSQLAVASAVNDLKGKIESGEVSMSEAKEQIRLYGEMAGLTGGQIRDMIADIVAYRHEYERAAALPDATNTITTVFQSVQQEHGGGPIGGPAGGDVPAMLQQGEFVINRESAARIGPAILTRLNQMHSGGQARHGAGWGHREGVDDPKYCIRREDGSLDCFRDSHGAGWWSRQDERIRPPGDIIRQGHGPGWWQRHGEQGMGPTVTVNIMGDVLSADLPDMIEEGARRALVMLGRP